MELVKPTKNSNLSQNK